jgi:heavy metal sensor kinase
MKPPGERFGFLKRVGFRLAAGYLLFIALLLAVIGLFFYNALIAVQISQARALLEDDWSALGTFLGHNESGPIWNYDISNPQDSFMVERLQRVFMMADDAGNLLQVSPAYRIIGVEPLSVIRDVLARGSPVWAERTDLFGTKYLVRMDTVVGPHGRRYFISQGRSRGLTDPAVNQFVRRYLISAPVIMVLGGLLGLYLTRRGLRPLKDVVRAADSVTGSNLTLRIPTRGAGDELDQLIDTLNRMVERLESSFQQMRRFTADVSHELRTPITAVRGHLEVALMTSESEEQLREAIQTALEATDRLSDFVRAMLQLSQAESGQLVLRITEQDVVPLVRDVLDQYRFTAEEAGVRLEAALPESCPAAVDRLQFERLLSNLLSNAVKYTPAGGQVRVELSSNPHRLELAVQDTGRGIAPEHLEHIFDRFYRVPSTDVREERGLGLGLSFVAWIVKAHGGRIDVHSEPGKGTRFLVTLPAKVGAGPRRLQEARSAS